MGYKLKNALPKVVVIDDDISFQELFKWGTEIENNCFEVLSAYNGEEGLKLIRDKQPDLVLLDIRLPGMDGYKIFDIINHEAWGKKPSVFLITSYFVSHQDRVKTLSMGAYDYISRPVEMAHLIRKMQACLQKKQTKYSE